MPSSGQVRLHDAMLSLLTWYGGTSIMPCSSSVSASTVVHKERLPKGSGCLMVSFSPSLLTVFDTGFLPVDYKGRGEPWKRACSKCVFSFQKI